MFSQYFNNYLQIVSSSSLQNPRIRLPKQPTTYYIKVGGGNSRTHLILNPKYYKLILHPFVCIKNHNNFRQIRSLWSLLLTQVAKSPLTWDSDSAKKTDIPTLDQKNFQLYY